MRLVKTPWNENVKNEIEGMRTRIRRKTEGAVFTMRHAVDEKRKNERNKMKDPNLKQKTLVVQVRTIGTVHSTK